MSFGEKRQFCEEDDPQFNKLFVTHNLHSSQHHPVGRHWQSQGATTFSPKDFVLPLFLLNDDDAEMACEKFPGIFMRGINKMIEYLKPLVENKLASVLLFPSQLSYYDYEQMYLISENPMLRAAEKLKEHFPELQVMADLCLCSFHVSGHCALFRPDDKIAFPKTREALTRLALRYAGSGFDVIAPSDMVDGRIEPMRENLNRDGYNHVSIMAYSAKFASCLYGPFRGAAGSAPLFGDRSTYQLPPGSAHLAERAMERDRDEGADVMMVKPASLYLDVVCRYRAQHPSEPIAVYQVSGEYTTLVLAINAGVYEKKKILFETMTSFKRAGANIIISYFTPDILAYLRDNEFHD